MYCIQLRIHQRGGQPKMGGCTAALRVALAVWLLQVIAVSAQDSICQQLAPSPTLTMFVDQLPIPSSINLPDYTINISAYKITQKMHRDLPPTTLYAYGTSQTDAQYPGHTLEARQNYPAYIYWNNHIPDLHHFLTIDNTVHWAMPPHGGVPTVVHLHGAETQSLYDGHPDAWFTPFGDYGPTYTTQNYTYPNAQKPTMLWYHDHVQGITHVNVNAGMTGLYIIRSLEDQCLTNYFPPLVFEIPLVLKDLQFWPNGSINFPNIGDNPAIHTQWCPKYIFGDTILVNGKAWPYLNVYPRLYRFRFLNGANARFFNLSMSDPSLSFYKIGTEGGYLPGGQPQIVKSLMIAPAERYDILVDFSRLTPGSVVYFNNSSPAPFPDGDPNFSPPQTNTVMKFVVKSWPFGTTNYGPLMWEVLRCLQDASGINSPYANFNDVSVYRELTLSEYNDAAGNPIIATLENRTWPEPVMVIPKVGATEIWEMINETPDGHPIHVHLIQFEVINSQPFNQTPFDAGDCNIRIPYGQPGTCFTGPPVPPAIYQTGLKDTAIVWPGNVTRYGLHFVASTGGPFPFDPTVGPGYVWHCHILDHEDNDMMRPYKLTH